MKDVHAFEDFYQMSASSPSIQFNQSPTSSKGSGESVLGRFLKLGKSRSDVNSQPKRRGRGDVDAEDEFRLTISSSAQNLRGGGARGAEKMVQRANLRKDNVSKSHSWIFGPSPGSSSGGGGGGAAKEHSPLGHTQFAADNYLQHSPSRHLHQQQHPHLLHPHPADYGHSHHYFQVPAPMPMPMQMSMDYCHACQGTGSGGAAAGLLAPARAPEFCHACNISALTAANASKFAKQQHHHKQKQQQPEADSNSNSKSFAFASSVRKLTWKSLKQAVKKRPSIDSLKPAPLPPDASWSSNGNFLDAVGGGGGPGLFMSQDDVLNATTTNYFFPEKKYQKGATSATAYFGSCTDLFTGVGRNGAGAMGAYDHMTPPQHMTASVRVRPKRSRETWHFDGGGSNDLGGPTSNYQQQDGPHAHGAYHSEWDLRNYTPYEEWLTVANSSKSLIAADADNGFTQGVDVDVDALKSIGEPFEVTLVHSNGNSASESGSIQNTAAVAAKINRPSTNNNSGNCSGTTINGNNVGANNGKGVIAAAVGSSVIVSSSSSSASASLSMSSPAPTSNPQDIYSNGGVKRFSILNNELNAYLLNKRNQDNVAGEMEQHMTDGEDDQEEPAVTVVEGSRSRVRIAGQGITIAGHGHGQRVGRSNSSSSASTSKKTSNKGNHPHHLIISSASSESDLTLTGAKSSFSTFTGGGTKTGANASTIVNVTTTRIGMTDDDDGEFESQSHYYSPSSSNNAFSSSSDSVNKVLTSTSSSSNNGNVKLRPIVKSQKREREREREERENEDRNGTTTVEVSTAKNFAPSQSQSQSQKTATASSATNSNQNQKYGALRRRKHGRSAGSGKHVGGKNLLRETIYEEDSGEDSIQNSSSTSNGNDNANANGIYTVKIVVNSNTNSHNGAGPADYAYVKPILKTNSHYASVTSSITNSTSTSTQQGTNSYAYAHTNLTSSPDCAPHSDSVNPARKGVKFDIGHGGGGGQKKKVQFNKEKVVIMCGADPDEDEDEEESQSSEDGSGSGSEEKAETEESMGVSGQFEFESTPAKKDYDYSDWNSCIQDHEHEQDDQDKGSFLGVGGSVSVSVSEDSSPRGAQTEAGYEHEAEVEEQSVSTEVNNLIGYEYVTSTAASSHSQLLSSAEAEAEPSSNNGNEIISTASSVAICTSSQAQVQAHQQQYQPKYNKNQRNGRSQPPAQQNKRSNGSNRIKIANSSASSKSTHQQIEQVFAQVDARVQDDKRKLAHQNHEGAESEKAQARRAGRQENEMNARNSSNLQTTTAPKAEQITINNKHQLINKAGRNCAAITVAGAATKILNPNSLLFNDTTRIRLNQARPSLDQTFQNLNIAGHSKAQASSGSGSSGSGIQTRNSAKGVSVRPSHSFRTSAPPLSSAGQTPTAAPLRPREPPPPPPPARVSPASPSSAVARPQLPARPKSFPSTLVNGGATAPSKSLSHYARSPTTKAQISLPMPMLGFSTTNSNVGAMKMKPTVTANSEQLSQNSPKNSSSSGGGRAEAGGRQRRLLVKKSANSNSSLADKCEAVEKVLSQQLSKNSHSPMPTQSTSSKFAVASVEESPVYANVPLIAAVAASVGAGAGKPLPPPPVPPHQTQTPTPNLSPSPCPCPTASELQRAKSSLSRPTSVSNSSSISSTNTNMAQKAPQTAQEEIHYAATDLFDVHKQQALEKQRPSMEDEINAHHSHYNGNTNANGANMVNNEESMIMMKMRTTSDVNTNQNLGTVDLISSSPSPLQLPPPTNNKVNGYGSLSAPCQIEDVDALVGQPQPDRSGKSVEHVHVHNNAYAKQEPEPLYDDVIAMNRKNQSHSQVQVQAQCNGSKNPYAISPPREAPPPVPPHSASFIASLSKSTGANYARRLQQQAEAAPPAPERPAGPCLSDANTSLIHFIEEDLIYDDTSAFSRPEPEQDSASAEAEPAADPLYDDVLNFARIQSPKPSLEEQRHDNDSGTESNSPPPPPLPTSGPPVHLLPAISLELPVILSTAMPGAVPTSSNNTLKSMKEVKIKNKKPDRDRHSEAPASAGHSKSHSDLTTLINETLRLSKTTKDNHQHGGSDLQLQLQAPKFSLGREEAGRKTGAGDGDEELLDRTRSLLNELNEKLAKFSLPPSNGVPPGGSGGSSSSDSSSGVEEDYNSERNYSLSLHEDDCSTLTPNSSSSSPASGSLADDAAYKLSQVSKLVNETMALARGKFLDSMKLQQERSRAPAPVEEPIYEEINESSSVNKSGSLSQLREFQNRSPCPIYADTASAHAHAFDAKSIFDGASRGEILSFLESIRDRLSAVDSSSNSLGVKNKHKSSNSGSGNKKSKKAKDIERNDSGIGSEAGSIVAVLGAIGTAAGAAPNCQNGSSTFLTLCKDCHSLPEEPKQGSEICGACARKRNERKEIILEIYETELKYGRDLRIISDEFYNPIQVAGLLTKDQLDLIFLNVAQLIDINVELTGALKASIEEAKAIKDEEDDLASVNIGRIFVDIGERMMSGFESYCTRQANAGALLTQLEKEKELLRIFLRVSQMENAVLRRMNLPAFLMVPVQRVTRYPLLLSRLLKVTSVDHPLHDDLQMAAEQIEQHLEHMNNTTREVASHKLWKRISIINGGQFSGCSSPVHRRSSTSSTNSNSELEQQSNNGANARIRKMAFDVTNWTDLSDAFCIAISELRTVFMNGKSFRHIHACLLARGKNLERLIHKMDQDHEQERGLFFPTPLLQQQQEIDVRDVKLILVRVKNARLSLFREPLDLSNCIISQGEKENELADADVGYVEVNEMMAKNSLPLHFQGMDRNSTDEWLRLLQCHAVYVGQWRRRRGALANIMMNGMIRDL